MTRPDNRCCGLKLRQLCFFIGYMHLISGVVDIVCHFVTVAVVTNGFQCDINNESYRAISVPWLEPMLLILNLGTHGFYPYPRVIRNQYHIYVEQISVATEPKCYPGMLHVYMIDILNFIINVIWLKIVISYVWAVHKKNPEPMRMFINLSMVKLVIQALYFGYQPFSDIVSVETLWYLKMSDNLIAAIFILIVIKYTKALKLEKAAEQNVEKPPSYVECLINGPVGPTQYNKEEIIIVEEKKQPVDMDK